MEGGDRGFIRENLHKTEESPPVPTTSEIETKEGCFFGKEKVNRKKGEGNVSSN